MEGDARVGRNIRERVGIKMDVGENTGSYYIKAHIKKIIRLLSEFSVDVILV
jgi:hypothetical protein